MRAWTRFRSVVPGGVKVAAVILLVVGAIVASVIGFMQGTADAQLNRGSSEQFPPVLFVVFCFIAACFLAGWLLAVGYVYGDAKRRGMPASLWTLLVVLTPNLIGFLLYFALRKPLLAACGNCGAGILEGQRFCSACGTQQNISGPTTSSGLPTSSTSFPAAAQRSGISLKSFATGFSVWVGIFLSKAVFAYLHNEKANSVGLLGLASIGMVLLAVVHLRPVMAR